MFPRRNRRLRICVAGANLRNKESDMAMSSTLKSAPQDAAAQLRQLRGQVDQLMRERISPAVSDAAGRAEDYARYAGDVAREQTDALSSRVKDAPIAAVLISAAVGYLLGRLTR
jgi:ElaB/YqjD/DUF883 family membrane-anchored ribosome-binding protein